MCVLGLVVTVLGLVVTVRGRMGKKRIPFWSFHQFYDMFAS